MNGFDKSEHDIKDDCNIFDFLSEELREYALESFRESLQKEDTTPVILNPKRIEDVLCCYKKIKEQFGEVYGARVYCELPSKSRSTHSVIGVVISEERIDWNNLDWMIEALKISDGRDIIPLSNGDIEICFDFNNTHIKV